MEKDPIKQSKIESSSSNSKEDLKDTKKEKAKKAGKLGAAAMEAGSKAGSAPEAAAEKPPEPKRSSLWERLTRSDKTKEAVSAQKEVPTKPEEAEKIEKEIPLEHLSPEEKQAASAELAHNRRSELDDEPHAATGDEQDAAAAQFLANTEALGDSNAAFEETIQALELEGNDGELPLHEGGNVLIVDRESESEPEPAADDGGGGAVPPRLPPGAGNEAAPDEPEEPDDHNDPDDDPAQQARYQAAHAGAVPIVGQSAGVTPNSASASTEDNYYYERRAQQRGLYVGAVVGYFIGRRRGRINAEKRLLPVQKKLQNEVKNLQADILQKEIIIRRKAAEKHKVPLSAPTERLIVTVAEAAKPSVSEIVATEAKLSPMHIGHALLAGQNRINQAPVPRAAIEHVPVERQAAERAALEGQPMQEQPVEKQVLAMSRQELLATSEKVVIEGATLRQIYETSLVSEPELRRIVTEHLRGGDVKKALRTELKDNGVNYENDPALRRLLETGSFVGGGRAAARGAAQDIVFTAPALTETVEDRSSPTNTPKSSKTGSKPVRTMLVTVVVIVIILLALYLGHKT
jgi:hypothetical protein